MRLTKILTAIALASVASTSFAVSTASFYADKFNGRKTANGETFSNKAMTCAANKHKFGTKLEVTNTKTGKSVVCTVNDRIGKKDRIDLTKAAFSQIAPLSAGTIKVDIKVLGKDDGASAKTAPQETLSEKFELPPALEIQNARRVLPSSQAAAVAPVSADATTSPDALSIPKPVTGMNADTVVADAPAAMPSDAPQATPDATPADAEAAPSDAQ